MPPSAFLSPAARFASIVNGLFQAIGVRRDAGFLAGPVAMLLWTRLGHLRGRITRLAARLASGKGSGVPRRPATPGGAERTPRRPPQRLLPRDPAWLIRLVPGAAAAGSQLQHLLADPETAALIEAAPQLGRLLRPLCRSLGVPVPPSLSPPPRAPKPRKPRQPPSPRPAPANGAAAWRCRRVRQAAWPGLNRPYREHGLPWLLQAPLRAPPPASDPPVPAVPA
jgi:hypothetical protein